MRTHNRNRYSRYEAVYGREVKAMTDAERYVTERCPHARLWSCGGPHHVLSGPAHLSNVVKLGVGDTEIAAWADAANWLEKKVQDLDGKKAV